MNSRVQGWLMCQKTYRPSGGAEAKGVYGDAHRKSAFCQQAAEAQMKLGGSVGWLERDGK